MYSSSLSTYRCIRVLHCSKQCYSSSTPRPFSSCAVFAFTSSADGKWVPSIHFSLWCTEKNHMVLNSPMWRMIKYSKAFIGKKLLEQKGVSAGALSWCSVQTLFFQRFGCSSSTRFVALSLSVNTNHVYNHSHTQMSIFANNFTDFLNVLVGFQSLNVTWMLIIFHFLPTLNKSFVPLNHTCTRY